ncbi:MAG: hypothetical protein IGS03_09755 [Candidatus Sericytochromatia bacterium]|nr:hypothetical protein [Candidatus Sericytochromatia bacterium]
MRILLLRYDVRPPASLSHRKSEVLDLDGKLLNEFVLADANLNARKNITHPNYPNLILDFEHRASDINFQVCTFTTGTCFFDQNLKVEDLIWVGSKAEAP